MNDETVTVPRWALEYVMDEICQSPVNWKSETMTRALETIQRCLDEKPNWK